MGKKMAAIVLIHLILTAAWTALGGSLQIRTWNSDKKLSERVAALWGAPQTQVSPEISFEWTEVSAEKEEVADPATGGKRTVVREKEVLKSRTVLLDRSKIDVDLRLEQRRKGLLWYATYTVDFRGDYGYEHTDDREGFVWITYRFPTTQAVYGDFRMEVDGKVDPSLAPVAEGGAKLVRQRVPVKRGTRIPFAIAYRSQGLDEWRYSFGDDVNRVKDFELTMTTDFDAVDFPAGTISPTTREKTATGQKLRWASENLISGFQVGMDMPRRLNPGPLASRISFFAPVSLGFFFVWIFAISLMRRVDLHPMHYLFLGASFFAFHLLLAYTVDRIDLTLAFLLASAVSVFLVISYLRLVAGMRFAAVEAGGSQLIYLVLFSYAHFFEGFTGLLVTVGSILTLFALMQLTAKIRWDEVFSKGGVQSAQEASR